MGPNWAGGQAEIFSLESSILLNVSCPIGQSKFYGKHRGQRGGALPKGVDGVDTDREAWRVRAIRAIHLPPLPTARARQLARPEEGAFTHVWMKLDAKSLHIKGHIGHKLY